LIEHFNLPLNTGLIVHFGDNPFQTFHYTGTDNQTNNQAKIHTRKYLKEQQITEAKKKHEKVNAAQNLIFT